MGKCMKNINSYSNSEGKIWLNVASSVYVLEEFVNLDNAIFLLLIDLIPFVGWIFPSKYQSSIQEYREAKQKALLIRHDCRNPLFFPDNSVDHILCSHFLEHIFPDEMEKVLKDFYRVLRKGATIHIIVPDLEKQINEYMKKKALGFPQAADEMIRETILSRDTRGSLKYRFLEFIGSFGLQHRWMYDYQSLSEKITRVGFSIFDENETPSKDYRLNDGSIHVVARK